MKSILFALLVSLCLFLVSCGASIPGTSAAESTTTPEVFNPFPADQRAVEAVRASLANELGISIQKIVLVDVTAVDWADTCLELPAPGEACSQAVTPGFLIRVRESDAIYVFHTNQNATSIRRIK